MFCDGHTGIMESWNDGMVELLYIGYSSVRRSMVWIHPSRCFGWRSRRSTPALALAYKSFLIVFLENYFIFAIIIERQIIIYIRYVSNRLVV